MCASTPTTQLNQKRSHISQFKVLKCASAKEVEIHISRIWSKLLGCQDSTNCCHNSCFDHAWINRVRPLFQHLQDTAAQTDELESAGCVAGFAEKVSSRAPLEKRHQLRACLETHQNGDELVISKLDLLGRSQVEVINRLADMQEQGIHIRTLDGLINTRGLGRLALLVIGLLTGLAEVERSLIQERTKESVEHRRRTGGNLGARPRTSEKKERLVLRLRS